MQIENYWLSYKTGYFTVCVKRFGSSRFTLRSIGYAQEDWALDAPVFGLYDYIIHASTKEEAQKVATQIVNTYNKYETSHMLCPAIQTL